MRAFEAQRGGAAPSAPAIEREKIVEWRNWLARLLDMEKAGGSSPPLTTRSKWQTWSMRRTANPETPVRIRAGPPNFQLALVSLSGSSTVERMSDTHLTKVRLFLGQPEAVK